MEFIDAFVRRRPVFFCQKDNVGGKEVISNPFHGFFSTVVEIHEAPGGKHVREVVFYDDDYMNLHKEVGGRNCYEDFPEPGVFLEGALEELEAEEAAKNQKREFAVHTDTGFPSMLEQCMDDVEIDDESRILVIGSGGGYVLKTIEDAAGAIPACTVAVDESPACLAKSEQRFPSVQHVNLDLAKIGKGQYKIWRKYFDVVIADIAYSSKIWPRPVVDATTAVLKKGGFLLCQEAYLEKGYVAELIEKTGLKVSTTYEERGKYRGAPLGRFIARKI